MISLFILASYEMSHYNYVDFFFPPLKYSSQYKAAKKLELCSCERRATVVYTSHYTHSHTSRRGSQTSCGIKFPYSLLPGPPLV